MSELDNQGLDNQTQLVIHLPKWTGSRNETLFSSEFVGNSQALSQIVSELQGMYTNKQLNHSEQDSFRDATERVVAHSAEAWVRELETQENKQLVASYIEFLIADGAMSEKLTRMCTEKQISTSVLSNVLNQYDTVRNVAQDQYRRTLKTNLYAANGLATQKTEQTIENVERCFRLIGSITKRDFSHSAPNQDLLSEVANFAKNQPSV
ncbi:hypothetical protein HGA88_06325 [Candidatus Roizmanbacteria bacterium]|nr:hypothetical protein [Candidatus Roizmanbacteria bacterium]